MKSWALLCILVCFTGSAFAQSLAELFPEIEKVGDAIFKNHSPKDAVVIGVGQSPVPIMAYLQNKQEGYVFNLPISAFRYIPEGVERMRPKPLTPELEDRLFAHFDKFVPSASETQGREFVVVDYTLTGQSLASVSEYLAKYLRVRGRAEKVRIVLLTHFDYPVRNYLSNHQRRRDLIMLDGKGALNTQMLESSFDGKSEFGPFDIRDQDIEKVSRPEYLQLREELRALMPAAKSCWLLMR